MKYTEQESIKLITDLFNNQGATTIDFSNETMKLWLADANNEKIAEGDFKVILSCLPANKCQMAWSFDTFKPEQVIPKEITGEDSLIENVSDDAIYAKALEIGEKANADMVWPDPIGSIYVALYNFKILKEATPIEKVDASKIQLKPGMELQYEIADFNVCDTYKFRIKEISPDLIFDHEMGDEGMDQGTKTTKKEALENSTILIPFSQGSYMVDGEDKQSDDCPVFVLSKKLFNNIVNKIPAEIKLTQYSNSDFFGYNPIEFVAIEEMIISLNGTKVSVDTIHAVIKGKDESQRDNIWILNNPDSPIVLKLETDFTGGTNYCTLKEIHLN